MRIPFVSRWLEQPAAVTPDPVIDKSEPVVSAAGASAVTPGQGAYTSAARIDSAITHWVPSMGSADGEILPAKYLTDARVADLDRNDPLVSGMIQNKRDAVAGRVFLLNAKPLFEDLGEGFDEACQEAYQIEVERKFNAYFSSPMKWPDAGGVRTGIDIVRAAVQSYITRGEVLITSEYLSTPGRPCRTAVQLIDTERLSTPDTMQDSASLRAGVERDHYGAPTAYWIQTSHPADVYISEPSRKWKRVPARKPWGRQNVLFIYDAARPDQSRGISMLAPAIKLMRMATIYDMTRLNNARARARVLHYLKSSVPEKLIEALAVPGATHSDTPGEGPMEKFQESQLSSYSDTVAFTNGGGLNIVDDVKIPILPHNTSFEHMDPSGQGAFGPEFEISLGRKRAAAAGMSYESFTRDLSQANYSSLRAGKIPENLANDQMQRLVADAVANFIFRGWLEEAIMTGEIKSLPRRTQNLAWLYSGMHFDMLANAEWISAARGNIDELKEDQAAILRINNNISTLEHECRMRGLDYRAVTKQRAREKTMLEGLGLSVPESSKKSEAALTKNPKENLEISDDR